MANFKLEGEETPEPKGQTPAPSSGDSAADEFSFFLEDEDKPKAAPQAPPKPTDPVPPAVQQPKPTQAAANPAPASPTPARPSSAPTPPGAGATPTRPQPQAPPSNTNAVKAQPDLMRPAQTRPSAGPPGNPLQPPGLNVPAAQAVTPVVTEPDAAAIAQGQTPSDNYSSGLQDFGANVARIVDMGSDVYTWVARLAVVAVALSLAILLAGIFIGNAANLASNPNGMKMLGYLIMSSKGLAYGTLALGVSLLLLSYDDNRMGAIVAGVGLLFFIGVPLGLRAVLGATNPGIPGMSTPFFTAGRLLLAIGLFKAVIDVGIWAFNLPNQIKAKQSAAGAVGFGNPVESRQQKLAREANMFSPCWKLPFCREPIRVLCPAFLARKTCWKFGRGCYCDTEMVGRIVRNEPLEVIKAADTMQSKQPAPCGRCYIFLEHQTHKFRMISPLALPSAVLIAFGLWPVYNSLFLKFTTGYTEFFKSFSFSAANLAPDAIKASTEGQAEAAAGGLSPEAIAQTSSYILGALLGFFLLIYISKFIEWAIFKAKW